jgi:N-acetyl-gamma-glutamyl-phosphate reductase
LTYGHAVSVRAGIVGASGYTGAELLRLLSGHPDIEVVVATADTTAGTPAYELYPSLAAAYPDLVFLDAGPDELVNHHLDLVFLGLPHEASLGLAPALVGNVGCVVDLSAAFRLKDAAAYPRWYGFEHDQPELLAEAVYGLPERTRTDLPGARLVATPGCYVTAATLALAPLLDAEVIRRDGVIVDAASGVSGAGRAPKPSTSFCAVDEDFVAYGLLDHRHTPEIEQNLGAEVLFTPHLAPMNRGILATCYARPAGPEQLSTDTLLGVLDKAYADEPFVAVISGSPSTKATLGSNVAHVSARYDERTGYVVVLCAIDNLTKGASGGALQSANVALGLPETAGLPIAGLMP